MERFSRGVKHQLRSYPMAKLVQTHDETYGLAHTVGDISYALRASMADIARFQAESGKNGAGRFFRHQQTPPVYSLWRGRHRPRRCAYAPQAWWRGRLDFSDAIEDMLDPKMLV